ncbi:MarR family winged helix-turn-helix transcriptional regulator [Domibacillus mangrovi]|uniref:MarR family transcriptional regulator n=1 Tax=Domibacillus mangrovi TaxID=1714354 RepID=A0A1Q5P1P5_9BACI|nr:MarR family transcriptional regulator [Domibacillus mangrovi]OKL36101.1 MarR family transcriptional regulator [Domibacillus mangrovi]
METHQLFHTIHQLSRELAKQANHTLQPFGLYTAQWSVLFVLKEKGKMTQTELCDYLAVEAPPMTRTIQRLMKQGYVKQVKGEDRRVKIIEMTEQSKAIYPEWEAAILQMNDRLLTGVPDEQREHMKQLLSSCLMNVKENAQKGKLHE